MCWGVKRGVRQGTGSEAGVSVSGQGHVPWAALPISRDLVFRNVKCRAPISTSMLFIQLYGNLPQPVKRVHSIGMLRVRGL